ncbi:MAG: DUF423 domain-containing protein [Pseudomonadota bacterium]
MWIGIAGVLGFIAVAAGAFGAHGLKGSLSPSLLNAFETGAHYQLVHAAALAAVAIGARASEDAPIAGLGTVAALWTAGMIVFSGSLYALALTGVSKLGAITPIGGLLLLAGWARLAAIGWRG